MATVYFGRLAGEGGFSRIVAVKCMHKHLADDPEFRAMFLDEARVAARIQHPNVVSTIDVGTSDEGMFLVTEYITGESLATLVRIAAERGEPIPLPVSLRIMIDTLNGLHAAHVAKDDAGAPLSIVHRDVSPQNVIVATDGLARVLDFGIAKAANRSHTTRDGQLKGKLRYMAPEQFRDADVNARTDIYAASVVLWELCTGVRLFTGSNDAAVMARVLEGVVAPPSKLAPAVPRELDEIVARGLARPAEARFDSAQQMADALEALATASSRQVSVWVERLAGDALRRRAAAIDLPHDKQAAAVEAPEIAYDTATGARTKDVITQTSTLESVPPPPPRMEATTKMAGAPVARADEARSQRMERRPAWVLLAAAAVLLSGLTLFAVRAARAPGASSAPAATEPRPVTTEVAAAPPTTATISAPPVPVTDDGAPKVGAAPSARAPTSSRPPQAKPKRPPKPSAVCTPPYYEDPSGIRRVKPQCL